ncbi:hypothetical protein BR93DRAFT_924418 [Coniochaeta sp. PMI_546]|nr:hypothetical protein BR93DRAFT_924418 [Coniochaeta sp. PMI_546]
MRAHITGSLTVSFVMIPGLAIRNRPHHTHAPAESRLPALPFSAPCRNGKKEESRTIYTVYYPPQSCARLLRHELDHWMTWMREHCRYSFAVEEGIFQIRERLLQNRYDR